MKIPLLHKEYMFSTPFSQYQLLQQFEEYLNRDPVSYDATFDNDGGFEMKRIKGHPFTNPVIKGIVHPTDTGSYLSIEITPRFGMFLIKLVIVCMAVVHFMDTDSTDHSSPMGFILAPVWIVFWCVRYKRDEKALKTYLSGFLQEKLAR
jgi:hypothetical protein